MPPPLSLSLDHFPVCMMKTVLKFSRRMKLEDHLKKNNFEGKRQICRTARDKNFIVHDYCSVFHICA